MEYLLLFAFGAIIGSFLNVVGLRWNSSLNLRGRSFCPVCHKKLKWWELLPIVSFLILRGRCSGCKSRISKQYPVVEALTGVMFAAVYYVENPSSSLSTLYYLLVAFVFCIYIVIAIYDLRHKIIPDELVYASILLALIGPLFIVNYSLLDWLAGPVVFIFFALIWLISSGRALGFGDAKLGLSIGLLLGAARGSSAIVLAFWIGAATTLVYMSVRQLSLLKKGKRLTMKSEIPFAPFMILGAFVSLIFGLDLLHVAQF